MAIIDLAGAELPRSLIATEAEVEEALTSGQVSGIGVELPGGFLAGYCLYGHLKGQSHACLLRLVVLQKYRRCGFATAMVRHLQYSLEGRIAAWKLVAHTPEKSLSSQLFLRRMGFVCEGIEEEFYGRQSAYYFVYKAGAPVPA